ncbi:MAG: tRNA-dihydrouridine synthase family protein [Desulfosalsimonadaceae bacterium]
MNRTITLYMGPIRGGTDHIYRNAFARHFAGFDLAVAPFINCINANKITPKYVHGLLPENNTGMPVIPQILSKSAEGFANLANYLTDLGYDTVNWNLGCPFPQVANKHRGSGLLPFPDKIREFLDAVIPSLRGRLTIKTRLGREHRDEILALMPVFNDYPIGELIIHPRTGRQMYEGTPDLSAFGDCLELSRHPVVYNGDIRTNDDFKRLSERFPKIDRWMIGRMALVDPFLPEVIKTGKDEISDTDKIGKIRAFHDDLFEEYSRTLYGPSHITDRMKGLMVYFLLGFQDTHNALKKIKKTRTPEQYIAAVNQFFDTEARWGC